MIGKVDVIRWVLTLLLLVGVYTETGGWTVLALLLIFLTTEALIFIRRVERVLEREAARLEVLREALRELGKRIVPEAKADAKQ